ncbi:PdxA family dehydrogenase [Anaerotalea alkaliphila]|uniref:4-hydroxythreonine-4-phosphate dehydrogenase PdxA n=1 Tax=Anaerotalea alkaliphila TaxID=2662126 RepID=A0A7X5KND3_9FIRM|nr:4-hydroxythreonine-4-phosphate dehydrogenase PdxA [Anaerotalea alkaliphila]NDL68749.1 4-hydroxythreonine-4-phosphate dehydrogenase PdxA [Anaerotalea alkaliphila]
MDAQPKLGILLGDACGIGPEIIAKLCDRDRIYGHCRPVIIGDCRVFEEAKRLVDGRFAIRKIADVDEADWEWEEGEYPILDQGDVDPGEIVAGEPHAVSGRSMVRMIEVAMKLCREGKLDGFVYAPINTNTINMAGYSYESEAKLFSEVLQMEKLTKELNMLDGLWASRVTSHIPVKHICDFITPESVFDTIELLHDTVFEAEGVAPKIGVAALNPHAGEMGVFGSEEKTVIAPAIDLAKARNIEVSGPYSADILFIKAFEGDFDAIVTMYHDQGQIPIKLKGILYGVTLHTGMPFPVATSLHGAAYDKAGKGVASVDAVENAIRLVAQIALNKSRRN